MKKILAVTSVLLLLSACRTAKAPAYDALVPVEPVVTEVTAPATPVAPVAPALPSPVSFTVTGTEFGFAPSTLSAALGQKVTITFKNTGKYNHEFTNDELNAKTATVAPGGTGSVTFTPDKAGTYAFICSISGHKEAGMNGTLTVK